jgi:choline kinase
MAEAPELPADRLASFPGRAAVVQPDPARSGLPRVGVVLAAGQSQRLASVTGGGSKALLRLGGLSLVERAARSLLAAGLERVLVVVGHDAGPVATVVGRLGRGRVRVVHADRWADGNGASLAAVQGEVHGQPRFVLICADHLFGEGGLERLLGAGEPAVLIDVAPDRPAWAEGTRVRVVDQAVVGFGKHLEESAIDCGAFLLPAEVFEADLMSLQLSIPRPSRGRTPPGSRGYRLVAETPPPSTASTSVVISSAQPHDRVTPAPP